MRDIAARFGIYPESIRTRVRDITRPANPAFDHRAKLSSENKEEIRVRLAAGETGSALARAFGVTVMVISRLRQRPDPGDIPGVPTTHT